ncbi:hypothetical protein [Arthrobacter castelli]|uniref:hypothetical protein n=1 Tax=Arthrobacter castelli TaxID=271431 RepID=UPI000423700B|nr:hypothetical protein [Arthrobacter castelli]
MVDNPIIVLELVTSAVLVLGVVLLGTAGIVHWAKGPWVKTWAVVYTTGAQTGLRWHGEHREVREAYVSLEELGDAPPGAEVRLYYGGGGSRRWTLKNPHRLTSTLAATGGGLVVLGTAGSLAPLVSQ